MSGPAGGVVGYAMTSQSPDSPQPVIGFDMGGTSTDISRFDGTYDHVFETVTAGVTLQVGEGDAFAVLYTLDQTLSVGTLRCASLVPAVCLVCRVCRRDCRFGVLCVLFAS